jgi:hypothetical protein
MAAAVTNDLIYEILKQIQRNYPTSPGVICMRWDCRLLFLRSRDVYQFA